MERSRQDTAEVRAFFEQWAVYRKIVDLDYLNHRGAYAAVERSLARLEKPFSFLDLGAGDAACTSRALAGKTLTSYRAIDLSETALQLARDYTAGLGCPVACVQGDFCQYVRTAREACDVAFIGLSLHHLPAGDKRRFLPELRRIVGRGGRLLVYEPIRRPDESRGEVLARWWRHVERSWTGLEPEELAGVKEHVFGNDYPEPVDDYLGMMETAGFNAATAVYTDPQELYAVIEAGA